MLQSFLVALALLTRFGPSNVVEDSALASSKRWFAPIGAMLGFFYTAIVYILQGQLSPWILAWLYVAIDIWCTRGLHYDGLADLGDAIGSRATGEKFWQIIKDSRLGAFGAIALFLALSAHLLGIQNLIKEEQWYALVMAPIFGRILCVLFANIVQAKDLNSLGGKVCTKASNSLNLNYLLLSVVLLIPLGLGPSLSICCAGSVLFVYLRRLANEHGGCNGDFFGAIILGGQCIVLLLL